MYHALMYMKSSGLSCHHSMSKVTLCFLLHCLDLLSVQVLSQFDETVAILFNTILVLIYGPVSHYRDGDRLFYKGFPFPNELVSRYNRINLIKNDRVKLGDIIARNTGIQKGDLQGARPSVFQL